MNRIFKAFFNRNKNCSVVCSEVNKVNGKVTRQENKKLLILSFCLCLISPSFAANYQDYSDARVIGSYSSTTGDITIFSDGKVIDMGSIPNWNTDITTSEGLNNFYHIDSNGNIALTQIEPGSLSEQNRNYLINKLDEYEGETTLLFDHYVRDHANGGWAVFREVKKGEDGKLVISGEMRSWFVYGRYVTEDDFKNSPLLSDIGSGILDPRLDSDGAAVEAVSKDTTLTRKLTNLSDGEISADSTDAVNGSQLYELQQQISTGSNDYLSVNASDDEASPSTSAKAIGARSTALGEGATTKGSQSLAVGYKASAEAAN